MASLSRSGPILPVACAGVKVWQAAQPAEREDRRRRPPGRRRVQGVATAPIDRQRGRRVTTFPPGTESEQPATTTASAASRRRRAHGRGSLSAAHDAASEPR